MNPLYRITEYHDSNTDYRMSELVESIILFVDSIVIKDNALAIVNETEMSRLRYNIYRDAIAEFDSEDTYNMSDLEIAGISDPTMRTVMSEIQYKDSELSSVGMDAQGIREFRNKIFTRISDAMREKLLVNKRKHIIESYVEHNDYYRMLAGLPPLSQMDASYDDKKVYLADIVQTKNYYKIVEKYNLPSDTELPKRPEWSSHKEMWQLPDNMIHLLREVGIIQDLVDKFPEHKYLRYLYKKTESLEAREAGPYDIIRHALINQDNNMVGNGFLRIYQEEKAVFLRTYENDYYTDTNKYYVDGMVYMLLSTTIARLMKHLSSYINITDSVSEYDMKRIIESFGLEYLTEIDTALKYNLTRHINQLIRLRGSKQVLVALEELFNVGAIYRLVLTRMRSSQDLFFVKTPIGERNIDQSVRHVDNLLPYHDVVADDSTWGTDPAVEAAHKREMFSFTNTKFIGISNMINITKFTASMTYLFRSVYERRHTLHFRVSYSGYPTALDLFDLVIYTVALICKRYGYTGEIPDSVDQVFRVLGYHSPPNIKEEREYLLEKYKDKALDKFSNLRSYGAADVFEKDMKTNGEVVMDIGDILFDETDVARWNEVNKIRDSIRITDYIKRNFKLENSNTQQAKTYEELVLDGELSLRYVEVTKSNDLIEKELDQILLGLTRTFKDMNANVGSLALTPHKDRMRKAFLAKMIDFLASYRVQLIDKDVTYNLDTLNYGEKNNDSRVFLLNDLELLRDLNIFDRVYVDQHPEKDVQLEVTKYIEDRIRTSDGGNTTNNGLYNVFSWRSSLPVPDYIDTIPDAENSPHMVTFFKPNTDLPPEPFINYIELKLNETKYDQVIIYDVVIDLDYIIPTPLRNIAKTNISLINEHGESVYDTPVTTSRVYIDDIKKNGIYRARLDIEYPKYGEVFHKTMTTDHVVVIKDILIKLKR